MSKSVSTALLSLTMVLGVAARAFAGTIPSAPEIDGSTISAGLGLLATGVLLVRSRRRGR